MKIETKKGFLIGAVVWVLIQFIGISSSSCARLSTCGGFELFISGALGVGYLGPAWLVGSLFEDIFMKK
jgi:hypothetical protein